MSRRSYATDKFWIEEDEISHVDVTCSGDSAERYPDCALCQGSDGSLAVTVHGGLPPYQFSIDGVNWQNEEYFDNLPVPANKVRSTDEYGGIWIGEYTLYCKDAKGRIRTITATMKSPVKAEYITNPNDALNYDDENVFFTTDAGKDYATPLPNIEYYSPVITTTKNVRATHTVYKTQYSIGYTSLTYSFANRTCKESGNIKIFVRVAPHRLINAIQDYDGNWYDAVIIGEQVFLGSNLMTTKTYQGTTLLSYYYNEPRAGSAYKDKYGRYYSVGSTALTIIQGWHVPTKDEWQTMLQYISAVPEYVSGDSSSNIAKSLASKEYWPTSSVDNAIGNDLTLNNATYLDVRNGDYVAGPSSVGPNNPTTAFLWAQAASLYASSSFCCTFDKDRADVRITNHGAYLNIRLISDMNSLEFIKWYWDKYGTFWHTLDEMLPNAIQDSDGNWYDAVILGEQVWLGSNLRTTKYSDGRSIPQDQTLGSTTAAYYEGSGDLTLTGYYYNHAATMDGASDSDSVPSGVQGIAPTGWHVPSYAEYETLIAYQQKILTYLYAQNPSNTAKGLAYTSGWTNDSGYSFGPGWSQSSNNVTHLGIYQSNGYADGTSHTGKAMLRTTSLQNGNPRIFALQYNVATAGVDVSAIEGNNWYIPVRCVCDKTRTQFKQWYYNQYGSYNHQLS